MLRETAERACELQARVSTDRISDISMFVDLHLAAMRHLEPLVRGGAADDVAVLYKSGMAPEQIDPRSLKGHFCGCLKHSDSLVRAIVGSSHGRRVMADLVSKAMSPDTARVRYVDANAFDAVTDPDGVVNRLLTIAAFGGIPGATALASVKDRLRYWDDPRGLVDLILSRLSKRGILLALADAISKLPCALVREATSVSVRGSTTVALFSETVPPRTALKAEGSPNTADVVAAPPLPKLGAVTDDVIRDCISAFGFRGSSALPKTESELKVLEYIANRAGSIYVRGAHPIVRAEQMRRFGIITVHFCMSCHCVHGVSVVKVSKAQRIFTVFGPSGPTCSGCGSAAVVRLDVTGRVLDVKTPKGRSLLAPCTECGAVGPVAAVYDQMPFCARHFDDPAADALDCGPLRCAVCETFVHGAADSAAIECEDDLHRLCIPCHSVLPTTRWTKIELDLLRSRKGSRA